MNFGINFGSYMMGMYPPSIVAFGSHAQAELQAAAEVSNAQMGQVGLSIERDKLISQVGQMPAKDLFEREKKINLEMAKAQTYRKSAEKKEEKAKKK